VSSGLTPIYPRVKRWLGTPIPKVFNISKVAAKVPLPFLIRITKKVTNVLDYCISLIHSLAIFSAQSVDGGIKNVIILETI
jgi:hypothetical protein